MLTWHEYAKLPDAERDRHDVAAENLACAEGLPGTERVDFRHCLDQVGAFARHVGRETEERLPRFRETGYDSESSWRASMLVAVLFRHLGVRYNKAKADPDTSLAPEDTFIHGTILGPGGICASIPVLFAAVGRRLGYPIKLATLVGESQAFPGKKVGHVFARWEGDERFNIDQYDGRLSCPSDDDYRADYQVTPEMERDGNLMKTLTRREEMGLFVRERAHQWNDLKRHRKAAACMITACELDGHHWNRMLLGRMLGEWHEGLKALRPRVMPGLSIRLPPRQFPWLPEELERGVFLMTGTELVLTHPEYAARWWKMMKRHPGYVPPDMPRHMTVRFGPDGASVELRAPSAKGLSVSPMR